MGRHFVGREAELGIAEGALIAARAGTPQMVLVLAPAGMGKTMFGRAFVEHARTAGFAIGVGRAAELGGAPPFQPWLDAFETLSGETSELATALSDARLALRPAPAEVDATESLRFAHFDAVRRSLARAAQHRPVLIWLDDVHAADEPTLVLARALVRQLDDAPVLLVLSARDAVVEARSPALAARLAGLASVAHPIPLGGFDRSTIASLAAATLGELPSELLDALAATTGGHPFFIGELLAAAARGGDLRALLLGPAPPPASVRELVRDTVGRLSPTARRLLHTAAVIGRETDADLLARVMEIEPADVLSAIDEARRAGLAVPDGPPRRLVFIHALACHALATELAPTERLGVHARVVDVLGPRSDTDDDDRLIEVAHHAVEAALLGPARRAAAAELARRAGDRALRSFAYEEAARWFEQALASADALGEPAAIADLAIRLGDARRAAGDPARAMRSYERALALAEPLDAELHARAVLGAASTREFSVRDLGKLRLVERAAERLGDAPTPTAIGIAARLVRDLVMDPGSGPRRRQLAARTIAAARCLGAPASIALALDAGLAASYEPGSLDARDSTADEILALARSAGDRERELAGLAWKLSALYERGELQATRALAVEHQRLADMLGTPSARINAASRRGAIALLEGLWDEGLGWSDLAFEIGDRHADTAAALLHAAQRALPALLRGDREELARLARVFDEDGDRVIHAAALRVLAARVRLALGERERARAELYALASDEWARVPVDFVQLGAFAHLACLVGDLGERELASTLRARLVPYATRNATLGTAHAMGAVALYAGQLAELEGELGAAEAHYRMALARNREMGAVPFAAWAAYHLAAVLARRGGPEADVLRAEAMDLARRFGLAPLLALDHVPPEATPRTSAARLFRDGDFWTLECGGIATTLKHQRGLELIATLVAQPEREVHAIDLVGGAGEDERAALKDERGQSLLDARAVRELRSRVLDLEEEIAAAEARADLGRAARARDERDAIAQHLAEAMGLGGRSRRVTDATERARVAATVAIRRALSALQQRHPAVGRHLSRAIRTGTTCAYRPDPADRIRVTP